MSDFAISPIWCTCPPSPCPACLLAGEMLRGPLDAATWQACQQYHARRTAYEATQLQRIDLELRQGITAQRREALMLEEMMIRRNRVQREGVLARLTGKRGKTTKPERQRAKREEMQHGG